MSAGGSAARARRAPVRRHRAALALAVAPLLAGCLPFEGRPTVTAGCGSDAYNPTLVAMAQSVPTAALIPCVELVPTGWYHGDVRLSDEGSSFVLGSDREGPEALVVELSGSCDVAGEVRVPSEHPDTTRYEKVERLEGGYHGVRHYVYEGGCTTFHFRFRGDRRAQPVTEASLAVGFTTRQAVRDALVAQSEGRVPVRTLGEAP